MNRLTGRLSAIETHGSVAIVDVAVGDAQFTASLLGNPAQWQGWQPGLPVQLLFKETEVALAKAFSGQISLRNRLAGRITAIEHGRILSRVRFAMADGTSISSVITTRSVAGMQLALGDAIVGLVKSNEMSLLPLEPT